MPIQLMLDESSVQDAREVSFRLNQAEKNPENPVLMPGYPHEWDGLQVNWPSRVLYDTGANLFRCWYSGLDAVQYDVNQYPDRRGFAKWLGRMWRIGYAESLDGVTWTKPHLGQFEHLALDTNVVRTDYEASGTGVGFNHFNSLGDVWLNTAPVNENDKFLGIFGELGADERGFRSFKMFRKVIYRSPDGKRWMRVKVAYDASSDRDDQPAPNVVDMSSVIVDEGTDIPVKVYGQTDRPIRPGAGNRGVGVVCGSDLYSLSYDSLKVLLEGEEPFDSEIHWSAVRRLQNGCYAMIYDSSRFDYKDGTEPPHSDIKLAISRDGLNFNRIHPDTPLIPRGSKAMFDANMLVSGSVVEYGDMIYIYYHGTPCVFRPWPRTPHGTSVNLRASVLYPTCMGLASIQRDRFAFAEGPGKLKTLPLTPNDDGVWFNADGENISVTALDSANREIASGKLSDNHRQTVYRKVVWKSAAPTIQCTLDIDLSGGERLFSIAW